MAKIKDIIDQGRATSPVGGPDMGVLCGPNYYIQSVGIIIYSQLDTVSGPIESTSRAGPGPRAVC